MIKLFKLENFEVKISEEAYCLKPFKKIWDRDKTKNKTKAQQELAFIYFFIDPRSDYQTIIDEDIRKQEIMAGLGLKEDWKIDKDLQEAIDFYNSFKPTICLALDDARMSLEKVRNKLREVDLSRFKIKEVSDYIKANKDVNSAIELFIEMERKVNKEITETSRMRGSAEKKIFEDGITL